MKKYIWLLLIFGFYEHGAQQIVKLSSKVNADRSVDINYSNDNFGSVCVFLNFYEYDNTYPPRKNYIISDFAGKLFTLKPIDADRKITYKYNYNYYRGKPDPKIDPLFVYLLPFKGVTSTSVSFLNFLGEMYLGKEPPINWKSFQFISNKADTVCAIRKGIVIRVEDDFNIDTSKLYIYNRKKNSVLIEHPDGTIAAYYGLEGKNTFVKPGDRVFPNQAIGKLIQYDKRQDFRLNLSIYYLTDKGNTTNENINKKSYAYLDPYFLTERGISKLEEYVIYNSIVTDEIITKEMSKKEIKKLNKQ